MTQSDSSFPTLTGQAQAAVDHRGSHLQIIASAGSGKTETVSQRIATLVAEGVDPSEIVAFTFTEKAAEELKARVRDRVEVFAGKSAADKLGNMYVGTIHGFCFQMLTRYVGKYESYDVMDENQLAAFVQRQAHFLKVKDLDPTGKLFRGMSIFRENLDVVENELLNTEDLPDNLKFSIERFNQFMDEYRLLTFGQQIARAVEVLQDADVHKRITSDIKHLIVDEYQDVNPAQEKLISLLAKPIGKADLVVVGDDDQAIYQWRGSSVDNITTFAKRYKKVTKFELLANRRSRPPIVEIADKFAKTIPGRLEKEMTAAREHNGPALDIVSDYESEEQEALELAASINSLVRRGFEYNKIAVLVRGRTSYPAIMRAFEAHAIPVQPGGRMGLFDQPDADFLGRIFAWVADFEWKRRFEYTRESVDLADLELLAKSVYGIKGSAWKKFEMYLIELKSKVGTDSRKLDLVSEVYEISSMLGVREWDIKDPVFASRLGTIARFQGFIADFESVQKRSRQNPDAPEQQVGASDQKSYYFTNLASLMINVAVDEYIDFEGENDVKTNSVELMTVHASKGLEWDAVFLPSLTANRFPSSRSGRAKNWLVPTELFDRMRYEGSDADERRLFYVAMTRAREWLSLSAHLKVKKGAVKPSLYIDFIQSQYDEELAYPKDWVGDKNGSDDQELQISYSDIAAYLECGHSYWLRNLIGFPPVIVEEIGYGKAIHHLMRAIAEQTMAKGKPLKPIDIDRILATDFFLPYANNLIATRFRESAKKLVLKYMKDHADDMNRVWEVERPFELALPGVVVFGRADVILDKHEGKPDSLAIVDYKTSTEGRELDLQLQIYTVAGQREGLDVQGAFIHDLGSADRAPVDTSKKALDAAVQTVVAAAEGIKNREFEAKPTVPKCGRCDVRPICKAAAKAK
ncbi:DEXQc_UvrD domain containing protein [Candidatus Nanopelagicaceae bacterium]